MYLVLDDRVVIGCLVAGEERCGLLLEGSNLACYLGWR